MAYAVHFQDVTKRYGRGGPRYPSLRNELTEGLYRVGQRLRSQQPEPRGILALDRISFEVQEGEAFAIIGPNGAGKTTALKLVSRITYPTRGQLRVRGRVAALIEVSSGVHPELTARENIWLYGQILGMPKAEIRRRFGEIIEFAELSHVLDTPVKFFSSGMQLRLGFAIASHLDPDVFVVDEALAVGDAGFQAKCVERMDLLVREGRTLLFVSHNMAAAAKLCPKAIWLQDGHVLSEGGCADVISRYLTHNQQPDGNKLETSRRRARSDYIRIEDAHLHRNGARTAQFFFGDEPELTLKLGVLEPTRFSVELLLRDDQGHPLAFAASGLSQNVEFSGRPGEVIIRCKLPPLNLAQGKYTLDLILAETGIRFLDYLESAVSFTVVETAIGSRNWSFRQARGQGCILWRVDFRSSASAAPTQGLSHLREA